MTPQEASLLAKLTELEERADKQAKQFARLELIIKSLQQSLADARAYIIELEGRRRTNIL